jgi:hypothetical protein
VALVSAVSSEANGFHISITTTARQNEKTSISTVKGFLQGLPIAKLRVIFSVRVPFSNLQRSTILTLNQITNNLALTLASCLSDHGRR